MPNIIYKVNVDKDSLTSKMLFDGGKISVQENKVYMPEITIYRREILAHNSNFFSVNIIAFSVLYIFNDLPQCKAKSVIIRHYKNKLIHGILTEYSEGVISGLNINYKNHCLTLSSGIYKHNSSLYILEEDTISFHLFAVYSVKTGGKCNFLVL